MRLRVSLLIAAILSTVFTAPSHALAAKVEGKQREHGVVEAGQRRQVKQKPFEARAGHRLP